MIKLNSILLILIAYLANMTLAVDVMATSQQTSDGKERIKTIRVNNYSMAYIEKGQGEPLLLIHGALQDYRTWLTHINEFSEYNRTIAVSLRHYYPEKWDGRDTDLGIHQDVDDMAAFIGKLGLEKVNLLGHSRGGAVAMLLASKHPELVKRLILADPSPMFSMLQKQDKAMQYLKERKFVLQSTMKYYSGDNIETGLKVFVNHIAGGNAWEKTSEQNRNKLRQNALTLKSLIRDVETPFNCHDLRKIAAPVLMVTGEYSKPIYGQMNQAVASCLKQSSEVTVSDAGHMMYSSNPTAFVFEVQDFVAPQ